MPPFSFPNARSYHSAGFSRQKSVVTRIATVFRVRYHGVGVVGSPVAVMGQVVLVFLPSDVLGWLGFPVHPAQFKSCSVQAVRADDAYLIA